MDKKELTEKIIGCAYAVHSVLGSGFLEKVYENAMMLELSANGLHANQQVPLPVYFRDERVGEYFADLLVEGQVICELKACDSLTREHEAQLVNYLAATGMDFGLLINFGKSVSVKRKFRVYKVVNPVNPGKSC